MVIRLVPDRIRAWDFKDDVPPARRTSGHGGGVGAHSQPHCHEIATRC
jgi:hypothetical protein